MNRKLLAEVSFEEFVKQVGEDIVQSEYDDANYQLALAASVSEEQFKQAMEIVLFDGRFGFSPEEEETMSLEMARNIVETAYKKFQPKREEFEFFSPSVNFWEEDEMGCLLPNAILRQRTLVDKIYEGYKQIYGGVPTIVEY